MIKSWSVIFGIGLGILWLAGLGAPFATPWVTWLDALGALCAFLIAAGVSDTSPRNSRISSTLLLSGGLFVVGLVGIFTRVVAWQSWWTFAIACGFLVLSVASGSERRILGARTEDRIQDRFRKSA